MTSDILTTSETAKILGLSPERIRQLHRTGELSAIQTSSGQRIFMRRDVELLLEKRGVKAEHGSKSRKEDKPHA